MDRVNVQSNRYISRLFFKTVKEPEKGTVRGLFVTRYFRTTKTEILYKVFRVECMSWEVFNRDRMNITCKQ